MSDKYLLNYFLITTYKSEETVPILNYFYKYSSLPLDILSPYPDNCSKSYLDWIQLYWGATINPSLHLIEVNHNLVLLSLYISDKYIINHYYSTLWLNLIYHYFSLSSVSILLSTSTSFSLPSLLTYESLNLHLIR